MCYEKWNESKQVTEASEQARKEADRAIEKRSRPPGPSAGRKRNPGPRWNPKKPPPERSYRYPEIQNPALAGFCLFEGG